VKNKIIEKGNLMRGLSDIFLANIALIFSLYLRFTFQIISEDPKPIVKYLF